MTWADRVSVASSVIDLLIKAEIHAFAMLGIGGLMYTHGNHEQGAAIITAGIAVFRGNRQ